MRKWIIIGLLLIVVASLAFTSRLWLLVLSEIIPPIEEFNDNHKDAIASLTGIFGMLIGAAGLAMTIIGLRRNRMPVVREPSPHVEAHEGAAAIVGDVSGDIITGDNPIVADKVEVYNAPVVTGIEALHQMPSPPHDFTGRSAELEELLEAVRERGVTISGLQGMGGIGKTALALVLADRLKDNYPDAQFYLDLRGAEQSPVTAEEAMAHVIRGFHPTAQLPEGQAEMEALYRSALDGKRALLLMDNARDGEQVEPLIPPSGCLLLVTSRQRFTLPGLYLKDLDTLPPEDAERFLLTIAPRIEERAAEIAGLCGYLPFALQIAARVLAEREDMTPEQYVGRLQDSRRRLALIDASLGLSYELLDEDLQKLWRMLAVFPESFDVAGAAAVWEMEADAAHDRLGDLLRYSFVEWNEASRRYSLHDLARVYADSRLEQQERSEAKRLHSAHYIGVLNQTNDLYRQGGESIAEGLGLFDAELQNISAGQRWAADHSDEGETARELYSSYPNAGANVLLIRLHPREHIGWMEAGLIAARRLGSRSAEAAHLGNLGNAYENLGEYRRAIEYNEQALTILVELGNRLGEGNSLGNLGLAYYALGGYRRAIEYYEQSLVIKREISNRQGEGNSLGNLGLAYRSLGEYRRAIDYQEQRLEITREIGDRLGEGNSLGNLGLAYRSLGEYRRAIDYQEQRLEITREIGDRLGEGQSLGNLGSAYHSLGEYRRAIEYHEQSLEIAREIGDRLGEGNSLFNMGLTLNDLGDRAAAIARAEAALKIYEEIEAPYVDQVRSQLAEWRGG